MNLTVLLIVPAATVLTTDAGALASRSAARAQVVEILRAE